MIFASGTQYVAATRTRAFTVLELTTILLCSARGSHLQFNEGAVDPSMNKGT